MATNYHAQIQQLYIAYFNRPADGGGLAYWDKVVTAANGDISAVSAGFAASAEYAARYAGLEEKVIQAQVFQNLFGGPLQLGDVYLGVPNGPAPTDKLIKYFVESAQGTNKAALDNKVKAALGFTAAFDTAAEAAAYTGPAALHVVTAFLSSVTADAASLPADFNSAVASVLSIPKARLALTTGADVVVGTSANDTFVAPLTNGANTLQGGDFIDGGAGNGDRLNAELSDATAAAQTWSSSGLEAVSIRAVASVANASTATPARATVSPITAAGVTQWESHRSSTDLIIDGIRLLPTQVTKDITIVMESTDAGDVDFDARFAQDAIRAHTPNVLDGGFATGLYVSGRPPLMESPYNGFWFHFNGVLTHVTSPAIDAAETYEQLLAAVQATVSAMPALAQVTVTQGPSFPLYDRSDASAPGTGFGIVLTAPSGNVFSVSPGFGWTTSGAVPPAVGGQSLHPRSNPDQASATIVLDDVGRGGTGGDLVVGVETSAVYPVFDIPRFDIEVRDNSKLQTISSTNGALRELVFTNGATSDHGSGAANRGDLTVLGTSGLVVPGTGSDALPKKPAHNEFGFSDVVVIDASAMTGKISFDAYIAISGMFKYSEAVVLAGTDFVYSGGGNDDSMTVTIEGSVLASNARKLFGRGDAIFRASGGAGNDDVKVVVKNGTASLGHNVFLNGGAGNDTLRMDGAANAIVQFGAGEFGSDKVTGFTSGAGTGNDQLDFNALGGRGAAFSGTAISNANNAITVQLQTGANDSVAEIAALYADGASASQHVFVAYDAGNVGKVYTVVDGAASAVQVTLVGSVDLTDTAWSTLVAANFS